MVLLNTRRCLAGVDEAGLGPILGPLVVAGVAMTGPEGTDPWRALRDVVVKSRPKPGQLQVADSKKVKQGPRGLERLERTALTFWSAGTGALPRTLAELLAQAQIDVARLRRCPWYADLGLPLPLFGDRADFELRVHLLRKAVAASDLEVLKVAVRPVDVEEFNAHIATTDNKADTHFEAYGAVLAPIVESMPDGSHLVADRCGGRVHYREKLRARFPGARIHKLRETPLVSSYRILRGDTSVRVTFAAEGESRAFPTALASCLAKYLRELMVHVLNDWFAARVPGLKRTAGYYVDGHRFLTDVDALVEAEQLPRERLVRVR